MQKAWTDEAWDDYIYWQKKDKETVKRINKKLKDISCDLFSGTGKPEPLSTNARGIGADVLMK